MNKWFRSKIEIFESKINDSIKNRWFGSKIDDLDHGSRFSSAPVLQWSGAPVESMTRVQNQWWFQWFGSNINDLRSGFRFPVLPVCLGSLRFSSAPVLQWLGAPVPRFLGNLGSVVPRFPEPRFPGFPCCRFASVTFDFPVPRFSSGPVQRHESMFWIGNRWFG